VAEAYALTITELDQWAALAHRVREEELAR